CSAIQNFDGYSYAFIARSWARGQWWTGVNSYWSPVYPAVASLFVRSGSPLSQALGLANLVGLLACAALIGALARREGVSWPQTLVVTGASLALLSRYCLLTTPDVLSAAAIFGMVHCFLTDRNRPTPLSWLAL